MSETFVTFFVKFMLLCASPLIAIVLLGMVIQFVLLPFAIVGNRKRARALRKLRVVP